jgi:hypothetical protein
MDEWAAAYLKQAKDNMMAYPGPEKDKCGVSDDIMSLVAIDAASTRDVELVRELCDFADIVTEPDACNEWLYGRAGYLYLLRMVKVCFADEPKVKGMIDDTADEIIDEIMESPRPWKWHGKAYGMALFVSNTGHVANYGEKSWCCSRRNRNHYPNHSHRCSVGP